MMIKLFVFSKPHQTWELTSKVDAGSTSCPGIGSGRVGFVNRHRFFYSARNAGIASAVLATAIPSVCLSVCLSVTRRYCVKTTARSTVQIAPLDSKMCLVL